MAKKPKVRKQLSEHFFEDEFKCNCGRKECDAVPPTQELIDLAQGIRDDLGIPLHLNSGSRCPFWNEQAHGSTTSDHLHGKGMDIRAPGGLMKFKIIKSAMARGCGSIGTYKEFVHVGIRKSVSAWGSSR